MCSTHDVDTTLLRIANALDPHRRTRLNPIEPGNLRGVDAELEQALACSVRSVGQTNASRPTYYTG